MTVVYTVVLSGSTQACGSCVDMFWMLFGFLAHRDNQRTWRARVTDPVQQYRDMFTAAPSRGFPCFPTGERWAVICQTSIREESLCVCCAVFYSFTRLHSVLYQHRASQAASTLVQTHCHCHTAGLLRCLNEWSVQLIQCLAFNTPSILPVARFPMLWLCPERELRSGQNRRLLHFEWEALLKKGPPETVC